MEWIEGWNGLDADSMKLFLPGIVLLTPYQIPNSYLLKGNKVEVSDPELDRELD